MKNRQIQRMLDDIEREVRYTRKMIGRNALDPKVMSAMEQVPRNEFVPNSYGDAAFDNGPLPIGHGQTISQPYIVALMTDLLELDADDVVLEIGTGSGYQTAILSQLCKQVYTIEYVPALADIARTRLEKLGYDNITSMTGNGYDGWPEHAPYDAIIVTAAGPKVPEALVAQLADPGIMVIPVGSRNSQELVVVTKKATVVNQKTIENVRFVGLIGSQGWAS